MLSCSTLLPVYAAFSAYVDVNIVELVKIILLQCAVDLLAQEPYVMHVVLCGQIRLVYSVFFNSVKVLIF